MATNLFTRRWCCGLCVLAALVATHTAQPACAAVDARLLRHPAVSASQVAFVYAGDIWVVGKAGGLAQRLSSPPGEESAPKFSPDGRKLAFTGNYDGNQDIYVIDVAGGTPARLTHHPGSDRVLDWYPDGQSILMASRMESGSPAFSQLYKLPAQGGLPEKLPIAFAAMAALSPDGEWVAFTLMGRQETWKRYRGGTAPDIWLFNLKTLESRNVTDNPATDESRVEVHQLQWLYHNSLQSYRVMWSPDSRWLTYSAMLDNANEAIFLFDTKNRVNHRITSGFYSDRSPVFDPEGKYLYCQSDRDMRPVYGRIDPDMWTYPNATRIGAFALRADVPSPLAARDDTDEQAKKEEKKEGKESKADSGKTGAAAKEGKESSEPKETKDGKPKAPAPVEIDLEGLERRFVILPPPADLHYSESTGRSRMAPTGFAPSCAERPGITRRARRWMNPG